MATPRRSGPSGNFFLPLVWLLLVGVANRRTLAIDNLRVAFQWKELDFEDPPSGKILDLVPGYKREENLPLGIEVTEDRLFVTVPRFKRGVAASLNYFRLNDSRTSPPMIPYPSWEAHKQTSGSVPEVVSTFRVRADRCSRLWVLDTGLSDILGSPEQVVPPAVLIYDLKTDRLLRKYAIPADQRTQDSFFANIAVEDQSCEDAYAYLGDLGGPGLVVYSWKSNSSWLVRHHFFHPDPQGGEFNVSGVTFQWTDGIFGLALAPAKDGFSTLYFHPLSSTMEFSVDTKLLRNSELVNSPESFHEFRILGSRGPNGQSGVSFLDPETGILFYSLANLNAIACWKSGTKYEIRQQGRVYMDNVTMVFPNDLKVDRKGNVWVLSDRLPIFMYGQLDPEDYNFRILTGSALEAVRGTVCFSESLAITTDRSLMTSTRRNPSVKIGSGGNEPKTSTLSLLMTLFAASLLYS